MNKVYEEALRDWLDLYVKPPGRRPETEKLLRAALDEAQREGMRTERARIIAWLHCNSYDALADEIEREEKLDE